MPDSSCGVERTWKLAPGLLTQLWVVVVFVNGLAVVSVHSLGTSGWLVLRVNLGSLRLLGKFYQEMDPSISVIARI